MRRILVSLMFILVFTGLSFADGLLDGKNISISGDFAFNSSYIFRGQKLEADRAMQAGLYADVYGVSLGVWNSMASRSTEHSDSNEIDYTIGYSKALGITKLGVGYTYYDYPVTDGLGEREFNVSLALDTFLQPSFMFANNYTNHILYYKLEVSHGFEITKYTILNLGLLYARFAGSERLDGGFYYDGKVSVNLKLTDKLTMSPNIHFMSPHGNLANKNLGNQEDEIYGGVLFSYSF